MPTPTYDLIASNVLTSSASSVTFSSIPATYRDLVLVVTATSASQTSLVCQLNSDTGSNYSRVNMFGDGSTTLSGSGTTTRAFLDANNADSINTTTGYVGLTNFMDYSATDKHKTLISRSNNANGGVAAVANRWASTSAINTIYLYTNAGTTFSSGSTFYLYGIVS